MQRVRNPRETAEWLDKVAWLMDRSIRIGPWSIGLDGLIGLIPGVGDAAGGVISSFIVVSAIDAGLPRATVLRMIANVAIDAFLGAIPLVGEIFDFAFKANTKNVALFREALLGSRRASRDWGFLLVVLLVLLLLIAIPLVGIAYLVSWLIG